MAFKRTNFSTLVKRSNNSFKVAYSFSKKVGGKFEIGSDAYIIPLGLETGFWETPCHAVKPHKAPNGELVGFKSAFTTYIKCNGEDSEGNSSECVACTLAQKEKERIPDKENSAQRIISFKNYRMHLPVLILGNSLGDPTKKAYPIQKVSILNDLRSETGLKFAYLEMSSDTFGKEIVKAYGTKLKEEGILDYELNEESEEFVNEVVSRLPETIIKVHGVSKTGFSAAMKEYSFFPFSLPAIASGSPAGEREAIIGYKDNQEIQNKICEFLDLFNIEVDNMFPTWTDKELIEYYNSAIGRDINTPIETTPAAEAPVQEKVEVVTPVAPAVAPTATATATATATVSQTATAVAEAPITDDALENILNDITEEANSKEAQVDAALEEYSFDAEEEEDFFDEE